MSITLGNFKDLKFKYKRWTSVLTVSKFNHFLKKDEIITEGIVGETLIQYPLGVLTALNMKIDSSICPFHHRCNLYEAKMEDGSVISSFHEPVYILDIQLI
jgi:hypothetical protein